MDKTATDPLIGAVLEERYRVRGIIARGGMATVYHAWDERLERTVAVKVMHPAYAADPSFVDRFVAEARSIARLSHPNVVAVFDQGSHNGLAFLVMEYVPNRTLRHVLVEHKRLSAEEAVGVLAPMLAALAAAHRIGMVHRDVKPENVLLSTDGSVKVADFGLARIAEGSMPTQTRGVLFGTVAYVAPEIVTLGTSDPRSDVYAAGIVLFEMLTGKAPFRGETPVAVAYQHVHTDMPVPSEHAPGIPYALDDLVARATRRDPGARPADAGAMLAELRDVETDLALTSELPSVPTPPPLTDQEDEQPTHGRHQTDHGPATHPTSPPAGFSNGSASVGRPSDALTDHTVVDGRTVSTDRSGDLGYDEFQGMLDGGGPATPAGAGARSAPPNRRTPPAAPIPAPNKRRMTILLAIVAVVIVVMAGLGWWLGAGQYTTTPSVVGMSKQQAAGALSAAGFTTKDIPAVFDEKVPVGKVASQDPAGNSSAVRGSEVGLALSKGPERYIIPDLAGTQRADAEAQLRAKHLEPTATEKYQDDTKAGEVVSSTPSAGTKVKRGTAVQLVISKGPPPVTIPDVKGQGSSRASAKLKDLGFEVSITYKFDETIAAGAVMSQDPGPPGPAPKGSTIKLVVSKGPTMVTVPAVTGKSLADATSTLEGADLVGKVAYQQPGGQGKVLQQSPAAGQKVRPNTEVLLFVF